MASIAGNLRLERDWPRPETAPAAIGPISVAQPHEGSGSTGPSNVSPKKSTDGALLALAQSGNEPARDALLRQYQDIWFRFCLANLNNAETAREAAQETALRFLQRLSTFRGQSELRTWSLGIALNVCRELHRRRRPAASLSADGPLVDQPPAEAALVADERSNRLHSLIATLSPRQRQAVLLRYFEELSVDGVAKAMGCATGTVKATIAQALRQLRLRWEFKP